MNNSDYPICIIGSGLSGVSIAKSLEDTGHPILIIDAGINYPQSVKEFVSKLSAVSAWQWKEGDREKLRGDVQSSTDGVKEKFQYGSNFSSRELSCFPIVRENARFYSSFAKGGLSNIWGAGLLPMHTDDMAGWPISLADLKPHYESVLKFMPMAGQHDSLEQLLPLYCEPSGHRLSRQTISMLARMEKNREALNSQGIYFGSSRLAARYHGHDGKKDCQYCGMCMYGCPYGILYSAKDALKMLLQREHISYRFNFVVNRLAQEGDFVKIYGTDTRGERQDPITASRVIIACGAPATTKIMLSSLNLFEKKITLKTSDQYYMPLFSVHGQPCIEHEHLHTMCQSFLVMQQPDVAKHLIHFSVYTYNDLFTSALKNCMGKIYPIMKWATHIPLSRLYFMFCYLHSDDSGGLSAILKNDRDKTLIIQGEENRDSAKIFVRAKRKLTRSSFITGLFPLPFYNGKKPHGAGNHFGGSFPMSCNPGPLETDIMGRVPGYERIHLADSSVFPSITATTITLSVMANAYRIGSLIKRNLM